VTLGFMKVLLAEESTLTTFIREKVFQKFETAIHKLLGDDEYFADLQE
jgi:hypothetical protein